MRQLRIEADLCRLGHCIARIVVSPIKHDSELVEVFSSYPPSSIYSRCVLHALSTPISFIKASSSWEHAEHEVDNLMAAVWAAYKELDESYVSMPLPGDFPSCAYLIRFCANTT
jgi:hypothetical protein